jgi:glycosyltransferase involved in cell wall biosynthesis
MAFVRSRTAGYAASSRELDVMLISTAANVGGMERIVCGLARQFAQRGRRVHTVFPASGDSTSLLEWCREQGVPAAIDDRVLDAAAPHSWRGVWALRQLIRSARPSVVNLHYGDNFISIKDVLAIRAAGVSRCVVSVHHPTPWHINGLKKRLLTRMASWLAHDVTTFSHATASVLRQAGVRNSHLRLIPCGVVPPSSTPPRDAAREAIGVPASAVVIGFLARHVQHKRLDLLIDAIAMLQRDDVILLVAGTGPERRRWEDLAAQRLPFRAIFTGQVEETDSFYAACDIFALPSELEGFGLVYIEAAFHGVPSVGTNVGGIPDAIVDGETGILVPPGDVLALRAALDRMIRDSNQRSRMGQAARRRALAELTETTMADRFERVFGLGHPAI